jgi:serine/threonine protein phosphatase PrpC
MVKAKLRCAGASDPGKMRRNNEDALHLDPDRGIFLVVDGIGGQAAGEKAAAIAVGRIRARLERQTGGAEVRIREAIAMANNEILRAAQSNPEWEGMACVLTLAVLENGSAVVGHVGDSRLYQIRRGQIRKITHDHSPVGEREDNQELSEAEAMKHPRRNEVFRDVGSEEHTPDDADFIEVRRIPFEPDSALVLCSDGLSDQVGSDEIRQMVERNAGNPETSVAALIEAANRAGGKDNVTAVVVEGEDFMPPQIEPAMRHAPWWRGGFACFLYGLAIALPAGWMWRGMWIPPAVVVTPQVLTVGPETKYPSIGEAMAEARAGDTVEVLLGDYHEQVQLKSGVTLRSRMPREAKLLAAPLSKGPAIVAKDVKDARVSGFRIVGDGQAPLSAGILLENSEVEVDDVEVDGAAIGIEMRGGRGDVLRSSDIHDCGSDGVLITGAGTPWISHNSFRNNKTAGLAARGGARPALLGNIFEKNGIELPPEMPMDVVRARNVIPDTSKAGHKR